jgi:hypothetical protein
VPVVLLLAPPDVCLEPIMPKRELSIALNVIGLLRS